MRLKTLTWMSLLCLAPAVGAQQPLNPPAVQTNQPARPASLPAQTNRAPGLRTNLVQTTSPLSGIMATNKTNLVLRAISLEEATRLALENNFEIKIERYNPIISRNLLQAAYGVFDPAFTSFAGHRFQSRSPSFDPNLQFTPPGSTTRTDSLNAGLGGLGPYGFSYDLLGNFSHTRGTAGGTALDDYASTATFQLRQSLLRNFWTDPALIQIKINKRDLKISELGLRFRIMDVVTRVALAYYDLIAAQDEVKVQEKALELNQRLVAENRQKVRAGTLAPLEEKQAESQAALSLAALISAKRSVAFQENVLKSLITDNYADWYAINLQPVEKLVAVPESYNVSESWLRALTERPDFQQARIELEQQGFRIRLTRNALLPLLDIEGGYGRAGFSEVGTLDTFHEIREELNPRYNVGLRLSIPLSNREARYSHRAAKARQKQLQTEVEQLHQNITVAIADAIQLAQSAFELVRATRVARETSELAFEAEQKKFDAGRVTSFTVLELQRDLTEARSAEINALSAYNKALTELYFQEGTILERKNIELDIR